MSSAYMVSGTNPASVSLLQLAMETIQRVKAEKKCVVAEQKREEMLDESYKVLRGLLIKNCTVDDIMKGFESLSIITGVYATFSQVGSALTKRRRTTWLCISLIDLAVKMAVMIVKCSVSKIKGEQVCSIDLGPYYAIIDKFNVSVLPADLPKETSDGFNLVLDPPRFMSQVADENGWRLTRPLKPCTEYEYIMLLK